MKSNRRWPARGEAVVDMNTLLEAPCDRGAPSPTRRGAIASSHILVVDDEVENRQLSAGALVLFGYRVDVTEDGGAPWKLVHDNTRGRAAAVFPVPTQSLRRITPVSQWDLNE